MNNMNLKAFMRNNCPYGHLTKKHRNLSKPEISLEKSKQIPGDED
jgi:hypothetical protein